MTLLKKIGLSRRYGKAVYAISAVLTLIMAAFVAYDPFSIPVCLILKLLSIPVIFYLFDTTQKQKVYFYLNLGISRREYFVIPFTVEFVAFVLLMVITGIIGYACS